MKERLQKILSAKGVCSRRAAEPLISSGQVTVNGQTAQLGDCADPEVDEILVSGKPLPAEPKKIYLMLNKPRGYVTTLSDEQGRKNASQLVASCGTRVYPVGRLDMDSEGLLIFTNDGDLANRLMHPSHEIEKTYAAWVTDYSPEKAELLKKPIELDGSPIRPPKVKLCFAENGSAKFLITIHEGRNRQVRRMCTAAGMHCTRLRRIQEGGLRLGDLPKGQWRHLSEGELRSLLGKEK